MNKEYRLRINIEDRGTVHIKSGPSMAGHVWYEVVEVINGTASYIAQAGFAPKDPKTARNVLPVPGKGYPDDGDYYLGKSFFTAEYKITEQQKDTLVGFSKKPELFGFDKENYFASTNSCVDFVWKALETVGMNSEKDQQSLIPTWNAEVFTKLINSEFSDGGLVQFHYNEGDKLAFHSQTGLYTKQRRLHFLGMIDLGLTVFYEGSDVNNLAVKSCTVQSGLNIEQLSGISAYLEKTKALLDSNATDVCQASLTEAMKSSSSGLPKTIARNPYEIDLTPIGAFYESRSAHLEGSLSIASRTFRVLSSAGAGITAAQLAAQDGNGDGRLSDGELNGLYAWSDLNEDGVLNTGEHTSLSAALGTAGVSGMSAVDYAFYTGGNAAYRSEVQSDVAAPEPYLKAPAALSSNYVSLRNSDNVFRPDPYTLITWKSNQIKLSSDQKNMIGTQGNDNFNINHYAQYDGVFFNLGLVQNFYAGGGNDVMGGSTRNDNLWGGTGNDILLGYAGDDRIYGESGDDELQGGSGHDILDGGSGNDRLFGQAGNDILNGGDGNDLILGFTGKNEAKQSLSRGETDNDTLFGGNGADQMYGGSGNDYMDGGADSDLVIGEAGDDTLFGGAGDDEVSAGLGHDVVSGGAGADKLFGGTGNDRMWGGAGNDIMMGFTPRNDSKQSLTRGETDNDIIYGEGGDDLILGGFGADQAWGGVGNDEIQGGSGDDALYGEAGDDKIFGQVGNDTIYGGAGNDTIIGFTGKNEAKQNLSRGETDNDFLYGGGGNDLVLGGLGNDYIDGGAGADNMEGGKGNDTYVVNSVNDVILEQQGEGHDTVVSSSNYILNANIEDLRLVEGLDIHGTGNSLNNHIVGNSRDNILDGVTGADTMVGGAGNDTYYVDNANDQTIEASGQGTDSVASSISHTLGENLEDLTLLDFSKGEKGVADGVDILVYGYPKANELDYMQGNAVEGYKGTCALTAIANLATQANQALSEAQVVQTAIDNTWCVTDPAQAGYQRGGSNHVQQQALLENFGIRNGILFGYNEQGIANLIRGGRGVMIALNSGKLWDDETHLGDGGVNHVVTVTGVACEESSGALNGFYIADSGRGLVSDMTRYISIADFREQSNVANAYTIYTMDPIKLWEENINATGNSLDNTLVGNRGDNVLTGGKGNDTLMGLSGNDTYVFRRGDGQDRIVESDTVPGSNDTLKLEDIDQDDLKFTRKNQDLCIQVLGSSDQITVKDWFSAGSAGQQIERIETADGMSMRNTDVEPRLAMQEILPFFPICFFPPPGSQYTLTPGGDMELTPRPMAPNVEVLVQAMAAFAPPTSATQTQSVSEQANGNQALLAAAH